jgi:ParB family chromosome partitioning protein
MLMKKYSLTQEGVGEKVGKSREAVANMLRLLNLSDELQRFVLEEKITTGHARALLGLKSEEKQRDLAGRIIAQRLSVREVEKLVSIQLGSIPGTRRKKKPASSHSNSPYVQSMAEKMQEKIGTKVTIKQSAKPGFGKIEIEYYSDDDLDRIFHILD